jgi:hypothetical protein
MLTNSSPNSAKPRTTVDRFTPKTTDSSFADTGPRLRNRGARSFGLMLRGRAMVFLGVVLRQKKIKSMGKFNYFLRFLFDNCIKFCVKNS